MQLETHNYGRETQASLVKPRRGNSFTKEKGKLGGTVVNEKSTVIKETESARYSGCSLAES